MLTLLNNIKASLGPLPGVATCAIGIETGLSPADYPIIRIVPAKHEHSGLMGRTKLNVMIYYGVDIAESDTGLEPVYASLAAMEASIIAALEDQNEFTAVWQDTVTDEDRLDHYKLFMSRFVVVG